MSSKLLLAVLFLSAAVYGYSQEPQTKTNPANEKLPAESSDVMKSGSNRAREPTYVRPDADKRFRNYVNDVVGPFALARYFATAGITTWRNTPKEWGYQWGGFGHRVASEFGKSAIKNTAMYGLDEALKVDSRFYRSKNRSVGARFRNALISPVTARKPNGKRVVGIPRIAGSVASTVIASEVWYPSRYDYKHGLKGGAITLGFDAVVNVIKEFVFKK